MNIPETTATYRLLLRVPGLPAAVYAGTLRELHGMIVAEEFEGFFHLDGGEAGFVSCCLIPPHDILLIDNRVPGAKKIWKRDHVDEMFLEMAGFIANHLERQQQTHVVRDEEEI